MNPNKALWEKGDFTRLARTMRDSGAAFVYSIGVTRGMQVIDLGCGDGTTAIPQAATRCPCTGRGHCQQLRGRRQSARQGTRTHQHPLPGRRRVRPAPIQDDTFDCVVSMFGAMFAPKPFDVAREMVRVTRPGGRVVMGN